MQIFYINLERSRDRAGALESHLKDLGLLARKVSAVDGAQLSTEQRSRHDHHSRLRRGVPALTDNEIACFLSHRRVWAEIQSSGRPGLVLEDDVQLAADTPLILSRAASSVFYDILRLAGYRKRLALPLWLPLGNRHVRQLCAGPCGANAYIVSPKAAEKLLDVSECITDPVDIFLDQFQAHGLSVYAVLPYVATLDPTFAHRSTIGDLRSVREHQMRLAEAPHGHLRRRWHKLRRSTARRMVMLAVVARWPVTVLQLRAADRVSARFRAGLI